MAAGPRIAIGAVIVFAVTLYMAYVGAASSWQYYLSVDECLAQATSLLNDPIRVNGRVALDSLRIARGRESATFVLAGSQGGIRVECAGPLPDNLVEDRQVVVEGRLESPQLLLGQRVLTRCASKYSSSGDTHSPAIRPSSPEGS